MWKKIQNFDNYEVNLNGDIRSSFKERGEYIIKPWVNSKKPNDYLRVSLFKNGKQFKLLLHRVIATEFVPNPFGKLQVNHKDGNRQNNAIDNLEWVTNSENQIHSFKVTGTHSHNNLMTGKFGREHNCSKPFIIEFQDGSKKYYGSETEFVREHGFGKTRISWARTQGFLSYEYEKGSMKGLTVHFELVE